MLIKLLIFFGTGPKAEAGLSPSPLLVAGKRKELPLPGTASSVSPKKHDHNNCDNNLSTTAPSGDNSSKVCGRSKASKEAEHGSGGTKRRRESCAGGRAGSSGDAEKVKRQRIISLHSSTDEES